MRRRRVRASTRVLACALACAQAACSHLPSMPDMSLPHIPVPSLSMPDLSMPDLGVTKAVSAAARLLPGGNAAAIDVSVTDVDGEVSTIPMRICRPDGDGPFPVAIINHGGPPPGQPRFRMQLPGCASPPAQFFVAHGYIAAFPLRRGYGSPDTAWAQNPGACATPDYTASALSGARDIAASVAAAIALPYAKPDGIVIVGEDEGGWATLGYAFKPNAAVAASVVLGVGEGGRAANMDRHTCRPDLLIAAARQLGALSRTKMLWITAKNDSVYSPDLARALHAAFVSSGGVADLVVTADDLPGDDPHALLFSETGAAVWQPLVEHFLAP